MNKTIKTRKNYTEKEFQIIRGYLLKYPSNFKKACLYAGAKIGRNPINVQQGIYNKKSRLFAYLTANPVFELTTTKVNVVVNRRVNQKHIKK